MKNLIKIEKARRKCTLGKYPRTWEAIIKQIPGSLIEKLSSNQIVEIISVIQEAHFRGCKKGLEEFCEHHELSGDIWGMRLKQEEKNNE